MPWFFLKSFLIDNLFKSSIEWLFKSQILYLFHVAVGVHVVPVVEVDGVAGYVGWGVGGGLSASTQTPFIFLASVHTQRSSKNCIIIH